MFKIYLSVYTGCLLLVLLSAFPVAQDTGHNASVPVTVTAAYADSSETVIAEQEAAELYSSMQLDQSGLNIKVLEYALKGYNYLQKKGNYIRKDVLSICDFSQSSKNKRLYVIDVDTRKLVLNTYVAHGKNSGSEYAQSFSNNPESLKSSLGFYVTSQTYSGSHGLSLRIEGLEKGFNDKAGERNIVVHGCKYIGNDFGGRSWGCPAVPDTETATVINTIKDGTCLFIYHPTRQYLAKSKFLNS